MGINTGFNAQWQPGELADMAKWQKYICWAIVANFLTFGIILAVTTSSKSSTPSPTELIMISFYAIYSIVVPLLMAYWVFKLAKACREKVAILYAILVLIPLMGLIFMIFLSSRATRTLQANGLKVKLMGVDSRDIEQLKLQSITSNYDL